MAETRVAAEIEQSSTLVERLDAISRRLKALHEIEVRREFGLYEQSRLIKTTIGMCDRCLAHAPAAVHVSHERVLMTRRCERHGLRTALLENDYRYYRVSSKDRWGRRYGDHPENDVPPYSACCGSTSPTGPSDPGPAGLEYTDQLANKSCTVLVEITNACNLACRVCYADSRGDRILPFEQLKRHLLALIEDNGPLDSVQLTGGEASLHPKFWDILAWLHARKGVGKIYLPTNGLALSRGDLAERLRPYRDKLLVLLQFDGAEIATNRALRAANPLKPRLRLVRALDRAGVAMQFTMTLAHGISEREIAWVVRQGVKHRHVRVIGMLPAFYSGRYELPIDPMQRITLSDVVKGVAAGLSQHTRDDDFLPIPCSHPNCGWTTLFVRRFGLFLNIARHVRVDTVIKDVAYKTVLDRGAMRRIVGTRYARGLRCFVARFGRRLVRPSDVFGIAIKPFMDRFTYDQDRVSSCCHHILDTHGRLLSFCEYNALMRESDSWVHMPKLNAPTRVVEVSGLSRD